MLSSLLIIVFVLIYFVIKLLQGFGAEVDSQSAFDLLQEEIKNQEKEKYHERNKEDFK